MHTEAHTHEHTQFTESRRPGRNIPKLAATWESWSTQVPQSATSSELFSHFPLLIQLLVTGSQCSTPHTFWVWHPRAVRKSYTSLSRCEEMMGREESNSFLPAFSLPYLSIPSFLCFFHPSPPCRVHQHPMTGSSGLIDKWLIRRDMFSLLKSTYYQ